MTSHSHLSRQLKQLKKSPVAGFSVELVDDKLDKWRVWIRGPTGTPYESGIYSAEMEFPSEFPFQPPTMRFVSEFWHPNVYPDGKVCISILHPPGEDQFGYEDASERWSPIQSVESVLISVISMLSDPNDASPANVDAAVEWRKHPEKFRKKVEGLARAANEQLPKDFEPPTAYGEASQQPAMARMASAGSLDMDGYPDEDEDDEGDDIAMEDDGVDPEDKKKYGQQLRQLADMGFTDAAKAIEVLKSVKGELERALEILFE